MLVPRQVALMQAIYSLACDEAGLDSFRLALRWLSENCHSLLSLTEFYRNTTIFPYTSLRELMYWYGGDPRFELSKFSACYEAFHVVH